ncbi:MAG: hypothetical protein AAGA20_12005 [Planctomycetota bacterium]
MTQPLLGFLAFAVGTVVVLTVPVLAVWLVVRLVKGLSIVARGLAIGVGATVRHVARFVRGELIDSLQFAGGVMTAGVILPLAAANLAIGRFRASRHYARAFEDELMSALASLYRVGVGHPVRLLGLGALTDGLERRLPELVAREPRTDPVRGQRRRGDIDAPPAFDGYKIERELQAGGSGARLFLASPTSTHAEELGRRGVDVPGRVVIKAFDRGYGSTIPQIVRESRSLEAAKSLGLIVEHSVDEDAFHYVMPYVPGEDLDAVTRVLHARSGPDGLNGKGLRSMLGYARDLCEHLDRFHGEGLWHKDIKPSNLMVADGRLHVVDFGLVTPLESALTLTTHGTEYFRDPELVRLALAGRRVKDVDGVKFDLYSAGAVLYSMLENSFPAHGSLSSINKPVPEALRWIVRRSMADVEKRYASAAEMGRDLDVLIAARDPFAVRPAELPSVRGDEVPPPASRARTVANGGAAEPQPSASTANDDVRRFSAFGMTAEVHGLDRIKGSIHSARSSRSRRRAEKRAARERAQVAAREARAERRDVRRSRHRGMLRAILTIAVFVGIGGGVATLLEEPVGPVERSTRWAAPVDASETDAGTAWITDAASRGGAVAMHSAAERRLRELGPGARVLIVTDPDDPDVVADARAMAGIVQTFGLEAIGLTGPGRSVSPCEIDLLGEARYRITRSGTSFEDARSELEAFATERDEIHAVLWLDRQERTGYLRTDLATEERCDLGLDWLESDSGDCAAEAESSACGGAPAKILIQQ